MNEAGDPTPDERRGTRIEVEKDKGEEWRWTRFAANENILADSGEGYVRQIDAVSMAKSLFPGVRVLVIESELKEPEDAA